MTIKKTLLAATLLGVATLAAPQFGCFSSGPKNQTMHSGADVPASQGTVQASAADNGNTSLAVRVKHLAPPSKVQSDSTVYVVWIQPRNAEIQSVGAMTLNDNLEGSLDTITPHSRFRLTITPEPSAKVAQPSHEPVFSSEVERVN